MVESVLSGLELLVVSLVSLRGLVVGEIVVILMRLIFGV